ncbi:NUDIX domain-containing protein [Patescibacteria group bacterium]|nr:NUDIX domain-containing protein [Patescibacteria group bacterium]
MPFEKSAGAVIFRQERNKTYYLLLESQAGWSFPKGVINRDEKPQDTARREIKEETGIEDIEFTPGFKENIKYFFKLKDKTIFKIVTFYLAETKTKEVRTSFEHIGYKWLPYEEALEQLTFKNAKEVLEKANNFLKNL